MAGTEVTQEQRDQVRAALTKLVEADEIDEFDNADLDELWRKKFRKVAAFQKATRETLLSVLGPGLVGYIKPDAAGGAEPAPAVALSSEERAQLQAVYTWMEEKQQKKKKKRRRISEVNTEDWRTVEATVRLTVSPFVGEMQPKQTQKPTPFGWDDRPESAQSNEYMTYLNKLPFSKRRYTMYNAGNNQQLLTTPGLADELGFEFSGTSDAALVLRQAFTWPATGLRILFELKKQPSRQHVVQAMTTLLLANVHSRKLKPIVVLTDLGDTYTFYWLDEKTIWFYTAQDAAAAWGIIADFLDQEQVLPDTSVKPIAGNQPLLALANRRELPIEHASVATYTSMDDLADVLSPADMHSCTSSHLLQQLNSIPSIAALRPARELWGSMYV